MNSKKFTLISSSVLFIYMLYVLATLNKSALWGNILSPIMAFIAFLMIFAHTMKCTDKRGLLRKVIWFSFAFACFAWFVADGVWMIYDLILGLNPEESILITYIYLLTNIFITIGVFLFIINLLKTWNGFQFLVDTVFITFILLYTFWIIFLNKDTEVINFLTMDGVVSLLSICLDVIIFMGIALWFFSLRKSVRFVSLHISALGIVLFVSTDLYYWYINYYELYIPNSIIDALYIGGLLLIAFAALIECYFGTKSEKGVVSDGGSNIGLEKKSLLMMVIPLIVFWVEGFVLIDLFILLILILIHQVLSMFLQDAIRSKVLLQNEKKNTTFLEEEIARRLQEIQEKNEELQDKNMKLDILSNQDTITNLYNRRYFMTVLEEEIKSCSEECCIGLMFLDLDRFKIINDLYGHQIGDEVLIEVSRRLETLQSKKTMLARLGGDEFVISYKGQFTYEFLEQVAQNLLTTFMYPIEVESYMFNISVCVGISVYPFDAEDAYSLLRNSDMAMYQAKKNGKNQIVTFRSSFSDDMKRKNDIELLLKQAEFNKEFQLFYQPQFRVEDKKLIGAEALLRWSNSPIGFISPAEFIPIAEEINVINEIGSWVLNTAIKQLKSWLDFNLDEFKLGINVSPKQLDYKCFVSELIETINKYQISTKLIDIEITESIAIEGEDRIQQIVSIFSKLGLSISIDDFGTGYSALSYLKIFPFERIKIAKQLVDSITFDNYDFQIVKAIIQLAKSIGIKTIAEGVETQEQFDILKNLGCDEIQGYLLGRPVPAATFMELYLGGKEIN